MKEMDRFKEIIARLRAEDGCPWDREQTHESLKPGCVEEAAEVVCAINILDQTGDSDNLREELGDLLLQIVMHTQIAEEEGLFTLEDVINDITEKMIRRHPHVFGEATVNDSGEVLKNWAAIKADEKAKKKIKEDYFLKSAIEESQNILGETIKRKDL